MLVEMLTGTTDSRHMPLNSGCQKPDNPASIRRRRWGLSCSLEAISETDIRFDRRGVVGHRFEKSPCLKTGKVECDDCMRHRGPPNLEIPLGAEIARMAGVGWINQGSTAKSID